MNPVVLDAHFAKGVTRVPKGALLVRQNVCAQLTDTVEVDTVQKHFFFFRHSDEVRELQGTLWFVKLRDEEASEIARNFACEISPGGISHFAFRETGHFAFRILRNRTSTRDIPGYVTRGTQYDTWSTYQGQYSVIYRGKCMGGAVLSAPRLRYARVRPGDYQRCAKHSSLQIDWPSVRG